MADLTFTIYAKYWTTTQRNRISTRLQTWAQNNGVTFDTFNLTPATKPTRHEVTFVGVNKLVDFNQETFKTLVGA